MKFSEVVYELA